MEWTIARHQVAIAGRVSDAETGQPIEAAEVKISHAPDSFLALLVVWAKSVPVSSATESVREARSQLDVPTVQGRDRLEAAQLVLAYLKRQRLLTFERPDLTQTGFDGHFHYLDLPQGEYDLTVFASKGTTLLTAQVSGLEVESEGEGVDRDIKMVYQEIQLSPATG